MKMNQIWNRLAPFPRHDAQYSSLAEKQSSGGNCGYAFLASRQSVLTKMVAETNGRESFCLSLKPSKKTNLSA